MNAAPTVWVTRAEPAAAATGARLSALGFAALVAPLLSVVALDVPLSLEGVGALGFTSANGVHVFSVRTARRDLPVFAVGDATAEAARAVGFAKVVSADADGDALMRLIVSARPQGLVLCLGPLQPAGDVAGDLRRAGIAAEALALYETVAASELPDKVRPALAAGEISAVLIHSARAGEAFARLGADHDFSGIVAVGLSPACLQPLSSLALAGRVAADAPREAALLDALGKALRPR